MKKFAIFVGILIALVVGVWIAFFRAPDHDEVCDKLVDVSKKELAKNGLPADALDKELTEARESCMGKLKSRSERWGVPKFAKMTNCMVDADSLEAFEACEPD
jgi:hypothetical protein